MPKYAKRPNGAGTAIKRGKTWQARIVIGWKETENGKQPIYRSKGGFLTRKDAWEYCIQLKEGRKDILSVKALYEAWEAAYSSRIGNSTLGCYKAAMGHLKAVESLPINKVTIDDWQGCVDAVKGKRTRENIKTLVGLLYKYAIPRLMATQNLATYIHTGENDKGTIPPFSMEQVEMIRNSNTSYSRYVLALIYTGMRPGELFNLRCPDYNPYTGTLVGGAKTEAGKDRMITVSPKVKFIFDEQAETGSEWLFPRRDGEKMSVAYFRQAAFYPLMDELGLRGFTPYSCRHTFANLLKNVTGSDTDKAALMGHANANMTKYYQSPDIQSLRAITDRI